METNPDVNSRRKACDLCFKKKIKCDMLKPVCSNCTQYNAECKTTAIRRRVGHLRKSASSQSPATSDQTSSLERHASIPEDNPIALLESRLAHVESQLQNVLATVSVAGPAASVSRPREQLVANPGSMGRPDGISEPETWTEPCPLTIHHTPQAPATRLPPLSQVLPVVDNYFANFNSVVPLFSQSEFMRMLNDWYSGTARRSRAVWATINTVMAMGSRFPIHPVQEVDFGVENVAVKTYMSNAQSVMSDLMMRDEDLLGLQVLLGLVLLYQETEDPRPGTLFIGAAVRLIHRMRFQSRDDIEALFTPEEALHRSRLCWITYMLDKEISLKHRTPSLQLDADIDLDLPPIRPVDGVGDLYTVDGQARVNYFRLRVQLAHIQGRTYDLLYSTRSTKVSPHETQARVVRLSQQLEKWRLGIPARMQLASTVQNLGRMELISMSMLYYRYFTCLVMVHGVWSSNAHWIKRVSTYSRSAIVDSEVEGRRCCMIQYPPLPSAWSKCVQVSRECLGMMREIPESDCSIWASSCSLVSALIIVLANMYESLIQEDFIQGVGLGREHDKDLAGYGLRIFNRFKDQPALIPFHRLHVVAIELNDRIRVAEQLVAERNKAAVASKPHQTTRVSGHDTNELQPNEGLGVEGLNHDVVEWVSEQEGAGFGGFDSVSISVFATEMEHSTALDNETLGDQGTLVADWMDDTEANYVFQNDFFEESASVWA